MIQKIAVFVLESLEFYDEFSVFGAKELTFVITMLYYHPSMHTLFTDLSTGFSDPEYMKLISANIGAAAWRHACATIKSESWNENHQTRKISFLFVKFICCNLSVCSFFHLNRAPVPPFFSQLKLTLSSSQVIMPWMIYFQQSAVVARRLRSSEQMNEERTGTLLGSVLTQLIMIGALVTLAAAHSINKETETNDDRWIPDRISTTDWLGLGLCFIPFYGKMVGARPHHYVVCSRVNLNVLIQFVHICIWWHFWRWPSSNHSIGKGRNHFVSCQVALYWEPYPRTYQIMDWWV